MEELMPGKRCSGAPVDGKEEEGVDTVSQIDSQLNSQGFRPQTFLFLHVLVCSYGLFSRLNE